MTDNCPYDYPTYRHSCFLCGGEVHPFTDDTGTTQRCIECDYDQEEETKAVKLIATLFLACFVIALCIMVHLRSIQIKEDRIKANSQPVLHQPSSTSTTAKE